MEILLDTNFLLTCVKQKIDFDSLTNKLFNRKIEWIIPQEVINELNYLKNKKKIKIKDKDAAELSLEIIKNINPIIVSLNSKNPNIDLAIVSYITGKDILLATLDKNLKLRVNNKILTIRGKKNLEII